MKKRSDWDIKSTALVERGRVEDSRCGFGMWGMMCFLLRYLGQFPNNPVRIYSFEDTERKTYPKTAQS